MKRTVSRAAAALLALVLLLPCLAVTAYAKDYDEIVNYDITAAPNVDDGSVTFTAAFDWKALETLPHGEKLKIGIPNGSLRDEQALTDNIERLNYDNSYMYVYMDQAYSAGSTFHFAFSWVQEYMYQLNGDGSVTYDYTPGWFDEARVDRMTLTWLDPAGLTGKLDFSADSSSRWTFSGATASGADLPHGEQVHVTAYYSTWPVALSEENSSQFLPDDGQGSVEWEDEDDEFDAFLALVVFVVVMWVVISILISLSRSSYRGGFGTHYVFYHGLWYPAGHDGKPKPGSTGTATKPRPPASHSGFGGGSRGGGFGGSGFGGGGGHCACASSCACACACACAGGGRAGCSAKNLYGAVRLDESLTEKLTGRPE